jgi:hypothetical protein
MFLGLEPLWRTPRRLGRFVPFDQAVANAGRSHRIGRGLLA